MPKFTTLFIALPAAAALVTIPVVATTPTSASDTGVVTQSARGALKGKVTDIKGEAASGVPVRLWIQVLPGAFEPGRTGLRRPPTKQTRTNDNGEFNIPGLEPALYRWEAGNKDPEVGFNRGVIRVNVGDPTELNIKLAKPLGG
ncbi:MAG: carboxypeptidase-like regulatory domain-containing protein [Planctomycetota bacterium]